MNEQTKQAKKWILSNFFAIAAIIVTVVNLWLMSKLAPLTLALSKLEGRVLANENLIFSVVDDITYIRTRVDDLYNLFIK